MAGLQDLLSWADNKRRVVGRNLSDLVNNPADYLSMTAANIPQTIAEQGAGMAPMGLGLKGIRLSANPSREELASISDRLAIHQDLRPGSADRVSSIMEQGLNRGMVDPLEPYLTGNGWSWGRGKINADDVYLFDRGALKYRGKGNPALKEGNIPIAHFTKQEIEDILSGSVSRPMSDLMNPRID